MHEAPVRPTLRRVAAAALLPLAALAGCSYDSPYSREDSGRDFSSYLYSIDTPVNASPDARPGRLFLPANLAVAQIGEVAPPSRFLDALRGHADLFARVEPISGAAGVGYDVRPVDCKDGTTVAQERARLEMARMQRVAREMGMGHLLLIGGTIDQATKENGLAILDLTVVGAFVVPSKQVDAQARASGALIDLESGRVVLFASADASRARLASTATRGAGEIDVERDARNEVMARLATQLIQQCTNRGEPPL